MTVHAYHQLILRNIDLREAGVGSTSEAQHPFTWKVCQVVLVHLQHPHIY